MSEMPPPSVPPPYTPPPPPPPGGGSYVPPPPPPGGASSSSDRTLMLVLAYLGILCIIPLIAKKDDREVQWHARNGLGLFIAEVAVWVLFTIVSIVGARFGFFGCGLSVIQCCIWLGFLGLSIFGIVKATSGQRLRLPMISDFADKM